MTSQQKYNRKSPRLQDFDYTHDGGYFITICTHNRLKLFGTIDIDGVMHSNQWGKAALLCWEGIPQHFPNVQLDEFVVMPNHVHGILFITEQQAKDESSTVSDVGERHASPLRKSYRVQSGSIIAIVSSYKSAVTRAINKIRHTTKHPIWQRSFHDRIIRNETEVNILREYAIYNPASWAADRYHAD
jgi:putative transposase